MSAQSSVTALVTDAYDGDTLTVEAAIWPDLVWTGSVRVRGVDTPEIRGACDVEKQLAIAERDYVRDLFIDESVTLSEIENDLYGGRVLAHVQDGDSLADRLISNGYGRVYDGGVRQSWCRPSVGGVAPLNDGGEGALDPTAESDNDPLDGPNHTLNLYDDNVNGRISCAEARAHRIAPVYRGHPAYPYMTDGDGDGVVCE